MKWVEMRPVVERALKLDLPVLRYTRESDRITSPAQVPEGKGDFWDAIWGFAMYPAEEGELPLHIYLPDYSHGVFEMPWRTETEANVALHIWVTMPRSRVSVEEGSDTYQWSAEQWARWTVRKYLLEGVNPDVEEYSVYEGGVQILSKPNGLERVTRISFPDLLPRF